ncbi:hypothetical protein FRC12_018113 [Ceratobasidium sp. 428]|nr:hypothetical protein FRC12_018113 [Ceratobasidium sp. 428]
MSKGNVPNSPNHNPHASNVPEALRSAEAPPGSARAPGPARAPPLKDEMLFDGIALHRSTPGWLDAFDEMTDEDILACAERENYRSPHLEEYLPHFRKMLSLAKTSIKDGKVVNKHASKPLDEVAKEVLTEKVKAYMDEIRRGINEDDLPDTLPDLEAVLFPDGEEGN